MSRSFDDAFHAARFARDDRRPGMLQITSGVMIPLSRFASCFLKPSMKVVAIWRFSASVIDLFWVGW
jgi:hypothetical protein